MKNRLIELALVAFVLSALWNIQPAWAGFTAWTTAWEAIPANGDVISLGDDKIRELKDNVRIRAAVETYWGDTFTGSDTGRAREGSARAFYEAACPANLSNSATDTLGSGVLGVNDDGRLCRDTTTGELKVHTGSGWARAIAALSGTVNLIDTPLFSKNGAESFDIHSHAEGATGRHRLTGSDGAWVNALDGIPFTIQQILVDTSNDCTTAHNTAIDSQVFGDAGDACLSVATGLNFTGRTGNSRIFAIGHIQTSQGADRCKVDVNLYLTSMAAPMGITARHGVENGVIADDTDVVVFGYSDAAGTVANEVALHASDSSDQNCLIGVGALYVFDLGNSS
jgi:hypothetical protein